MSHYTEIDELEAVICNLRLASFQSAAYISHYLEDVQDGSWQKKPKSSMSAMQKKRVSRIEVPWHL